MQTKRKQVRRRSIRWALWLPGMAILAVPAAARGAVVDTASNAMVVNTIELPTDGFQPLGGPLLDNGSESMARRETPVVIGLELEGEPARSDAFWFPTFAEESSSASGLLAIESAGEAGSEEFISLPASAMAVIDIPIVTFPPRPRPGAGGSGPIPEPAWAGVGFVAMVLAGQRRRA